MLWIVLATLVASARTSSTRMLLIPVLSFSTKSFFQALDALLPKLGIGIEISDVIRFLVSRGHRFGTCSVSGHYRADVDTPEDLNMVRA